MKRIPDIQIGDKTYRHISRLKKSGNIRMNYYYHRKKGHPRDDLIKLPAGLWKEIKIKLRPPSKPKVPVSSIG